MQIEKRIRARELAMQCLYQLDVQGNGLLEMLGEFLIDNEPDEETRELAKDWARGAWENLKECDTLISESIMKWDITRLAVVDKSILRLAVFQLKFCDDIPPKVTINEALELAKKFGSEKSSAFVNGVLDSILKKITCKKT
jgi:N utilization substance protein B